MPVDALREPLGRRGFSIPELVLGLAIATVVMSATVGLFVSLQRAARVSMRSTSVLSSLRKASDNDGAYRGLAWAIQESTAAASLSTSTLLLTLPGGVAMTFLPASSTGTFVVVRAGAAHTQADLISGLAYAYYNMDDQGHIMASTEAAAASFVSAAFTAEGKYANDPDYSLFLGAAQRNR